MNDIIFKAYNLSKKFHTGQKDKGGQDYFKGHILNVFDSVGGYSSTPPELAVVALLHDIIEDTSVTINTIRVKFGEEIANSVYLLTKKENESNEFDSNYIKNIKSNHLAKTVKIADLEHNMDISRIPNPTEKDYDRIEKYKRSLVFLLS